MINILKSFFQRNYSLFFALAIRDIEAKYKGSVLGVIWSIISPVLMLLVYGFVFGVVFQARWPQVGDNINAEFPLILFCGLIVYFMFSEVVMRSPSLIMEHSNFVKKVVFPLPLLSCVVVSSSVFHFLISFLVMLTYAAFISVWPSWTILLVPLLLMQFYLFCLGISWFLSAIGVFFRDVTYIVGFISTALMFLSPIFYPLEAVPEKFKIFILMNPLTFYVEAFRGLALYGVCPDVNKIIIALALSVVIFILGIVFFNKVKRAFPDVV